jgi:predicted DNA-binding protein (MmcQ/YjbR family)
MNIEWVRRFCLSLPHTTETLQWGDHLVFKIGGKIYAIVATEPDRHCMSFKCDAEEFATLTEREGIVPAPYLARAQWVALETEDALPRAEIKRLLRRAYELILARLPKKARLAIQAK